MESKGITYSGHYGLYDCPLPDFTMCQNVCMAEKPFAKIQWLYHGVLLMMPTSSNNK